MWQVRCVTGGITFKLFCSVPMCIAVLVDIAQHLWYEKHRRALTERASMRFRLLLWLLLNAGAVGFFTSLQYLTAFIGINSMLISILLPILFYYKLTKDELSHAGRSVLQFMLGFAIVFTIAISYVDVIEFVKSLS